MLLHGKISTCNPLKMSDGGVIHEARIRDAALPLSIRTPGEMVIWMSDDVRKQFPSGDAIEDAPLTCVVKEWGVGKNGILKVKGQTLPGHLKPEQIPAGETGPLPQRPAAAAKPEAK